MNVLAESRVYLDLCRSIAETRFRFKNKHRDAIEIPIEGIRSSGAGKKSILDITKLKIKDELLQEFLADFVALLMKSKVFRSEDTVILLSEKPNLSQLVHQVLTKDFEGLKSFSQKHQIGVDFLLLVGLNLSQAALELYAEKLKEKIDAENWLEGNCPVCGSLASIEKLRKDDGKRILRCSFCATNWPFKRIMCPFCGNEDHNSLRYFFVEENTTSERAAFRVDVCDNCKTYIKTLDERKLPESEKPDLYLENLKTLYLDILAQKDGYKSPTYWMIGPSEDLLV